MEGNVSWVARSSTRNISGQCIDGEITLGQEGLMQWGTIGRGTALSADSVLHYYIILRCVWVFGVSTWCCVGDFLSVALMDLALSLSSSVLCDMGVLT